MMKHIEDFKQEAVRIALTSGLLRRVLLLACALDCLRRASGCRSTGTR